MASELKLGMVGADTSHCLNFARRLHRKDIEEAHYVDGAHITVMYPFDSGIKEAETVEKDVAELRDVHHIKMVDSVQAVIEDGVDGVLIETVDGTRHLEQTRPFLEAKIPSYVDKPFTCSVDEAKTMVELAESNGVPLFSSSSLRFTDEIQGILAERESIGRFLQVHACSPSPQFPINPGLFWYGIHGIEILYTLIGTGCKTVQCLPGSTHELNIGRWEGGRIGTMAGIYEHTCPYGAVVHGEKQSQSITANIDNLYSSLLRAIVPFFKSGQSPVDPRETLEIMAFIEAAYRSRENGGKEVPLRV